jgi:tRNA-splicing ligase RtcB
MKLAKQTDHYFVKGTQDFEDFMMDLDVTTSFALTNREYMLKAVEFAIMKSCVSGTILWDSLINKVHNTVEYSTVFEGYLHRKGATSAAPGERGVIPGNMSTGSVVVLGNGCLQSLHSAPHGAGRVSSRNVARSNCNLAEFKYQMEDIVHGDLSTITDENPAAYKDPNAVLRESYLSVTEVTRLWPIINMKG